MKKNTGFGCGSDFVQTWKKNSIEEHRLQDRLRDLVTERKSCIQQLCDRQKEVRLDATLQGRHRLPQQRSLESEGILSDTSPANHQSQRRVSLQLDRQVLNSGRAAEACAADANDPLPSLSSSVPSSCHYRRPSLHQEPTGSGTCLGPSFVERGVARDEVKVVVGPRSRRGSLDGNLTSGMTFLGAPARRQSLQTSGLVRQKSTDTAGLVRQKSTDTAGLVRQKSTDTAGLVRQKSTDTNSQSPSPSTPDSKTREGSHFVFPPPASTSSQLRQSQMSYTRQFSRDFSESNVSVPLSFSSHPSSAYHFSRHGRNYPAKIVLAPNMASHRRSECVGSKMAVMHHVMQNSAIFAMAGLEDEESVSDN